MPQRLSDRSGLVRLTTAGALALAAGLGVSAQAGLVTANWLNAASGTWNVAANWSTNPNFPNNGTPVGETYHAVINAVGSAYTVTLNSAVTVDQFTLNSANATVDHTAGVFSVLGGGATISAGTYRLNGGTITGGTWTVAGGSLAFAGNNNNIMSGATVQGASDFTEVNARVRLRNGSQFTSDVTLTGAGSILAFEQTSSLQAGRSVIFDAATSGTKLLTVEGDNTLTIANGATVRGRNGTIRGGLFVGGTEAVVNNGLISSDFSGGSLSVESLDSFTNNGTAEAINGATLTINPTNWTNAGTLRVNGANSVLTLGGAWSNTGTLEVTNGTLNLGGTFTNTGSGLSGLSRSGGTVNLTGTLTNTGQTLALNNGTGVVALNGGRILNGSVTVTGAGGLAFGNNNNNALDGVSVQGGGDFTAASARVRLRNGAAFTGDVTLSGSSSILGWEQTGSLLAGRSVIFDAATSSTKFLTVEGNNTLTIDNGATVRGRSGSIRGGLFVGGSAAVVNNGLISSDFSGGSVSVDSLDSFTNNGTAEAINGATLTINPTAWSNAGTLRVNGANSVLTLGGAWSSPGTFEVTDGTLNLGGTFTNTGTGLGNLSRSGGTVNITGNLVNTGQTLALNNGTGVIVLNGGTITGGSVTRTGSGILAFANNNNNALVGVSVQGGGDFTASSARVRLRSGAVFTGDVTLSGSSSILGWEQTGSLLSGRSVIFDAATASGKFLTVEGNNTLTIDSGATVRGRSGTIRGGLFVGGTSALVNNGLISSDFMGGSLSVESLDSFTNNGTAEAVNGATLTINATNWTNGAGGRIRAIGAGSVATLGGAWSNTGELRVTDGTLNLGGTFTNTGSGLDDLIRSGGTVNITGNLVNTGQTLALNNGTGVIVLNGGTITGGSVTRTGSGILAFANSNNNALIGVSVQGGGDFTASSARVRLRNGSAFTGDVTLSGSSSILGWEQTGSLLSGRSVIFDAATASGKFLTVEGNNTLTIDSGATVRGRSGTIRGGLFAGGTAAVVNNGLISSDFSGGSLSVSSIESFTNNGTAEAINGADLTINATNWTNGAGGRIRSIGAGSVATLGGAWSNTGELRVTDGTLNLGGTFTNTGTGLDDLIRSGGTVNITGNLVNTGQTLALNNGTGVIVLSGGTITGGSVTVAGSGGLAFANNNANVLDGVSVQGGGDFTAASARVRLRNGSAFTGDVTLSGSSSILAWEQTGTLAAGRDVFFDTATNVGKFLTVEGNNTLTIADGASVRGRSGTIRGGVFVGGTQAVVNNGLILAEGAGTTSINNLSSFTNNGTVAASTGGTLEVSLGTAYALTGDFEARPGGTVRFANGISSINGDIDIELGGALVANYGRLNITGAATVLNGDDLDIVTVNGFNPDWGDAFNILSFTSGVVTGDFSTLALPTLTDAVNLRWYTTVTTTAVTVGVRHTADINRDNSINFADLNIIVSNFNSNGSATMGDVDEDGFIGFADLNRVLSFFNTTAPVNSVPAPAGAALAAIAGLAGLRRRR